MITKEKKKKKKRERKERKRTVVWQLLVLFGFISKAASGSSSRQTGEQHFRLPAKQNRQGSRAYAQSHMSCPTV